MASRFVFPKALKELRFHLSQTEAASNQLRQFLVKNYPAMKKANPEIPILIREASHARPTVYARFEKGQENKVHLDQVAADSDLATTIKSLIERH